MILDHRLSLKKPTGGMAGGDSKQPREEVDNPPPYTQSSEPSSSRHNLQAPSLSQSTRSLPPPLPPRKIASSISLSAPTPATPDTYAVPTAPPATVNQVHLVSKNEDIIGTFHIDPQTPHITPTRKKRGKAAVDPPHASFTSRGGAMRLTLGSTGDIRFTPKANVNVRSKSGNIEISLLPTLPTRPRIGLDVTSRRGDIMVYLPPTFSGLIQLNTGKGEIHILPALFKTVKVLKATDKEALILVGTTSQGDHSLTDLCQLNSRTGKVMVGLSGHDKHPEKTGFWKKLGQLLLGGA